MMLKEAAHLEDPSVDVMIILKLILRKWVGGMDWIDLAQDRNRWKAVANAVMNTGFVKGGEFLD